MQSTQGQAKAAVHAFNATERSARTVGMCVYDMALLSRNMSI